MEAKVAKEKERAEKERIMAEEKAAEEGNLRLLVKVNYHLISIFSTYQGRNGRRKNESIEFAQRWPVI